MSDELIYRVKFEADDKSLAEVKRQANEAQSTKTTSGGRGNQGTEKEISALKQLRAELKNYQNDLSDIQAEAKRTAGATTDNLNVQRTLGTAISEVRTQIQEATRGYIDQQTAINTLPTTYNELVEQNRALSIAMRDVPLADTSGKLQELQQQYSENNVKLKQFDSTLGNSQRNVGDYKIATDGIETSLNNFASALAVVQGPLGPLAGRINALATTIKKLRATTNTAEKTQEGLGHVLKGNIPLLQAKATATAASSIATKGANIAIKSFNIGLKVLRITLISLGIPALVIGIISIVQAFKRTEEGAGKLRVIMAGASATLDVFKDILAGIGKTLITAFEDPQQALKDLGELIKQNVINRIVAIPQIAMSAFDVLSKGAVAAGLAVKGIFSEEAREQSKELFLEAGKDFKEFSNNVVQLATGIEDPIDKLVDGVSKIAEEIIKDSAAAKEFETDMNAVLIREREIGVERARQNRDLQEARAIARDMDVDAETRLKAILDVGKAESKMFEEEIANERERLRIMEKQASLSLTDETTLNAIAEQKEKLFSVEQSSLQNTMRLLRDEQGVRRQISEQAVRIANHNFEIETKQEEMRMDVLRTNLIREGKIREALELELSNIEKNKLEETARLEQLFLIEFEGQQIDSANRVTMAREKAEIEVAERIAVATKNLEDRKIKEAKSADAFNRGLDEQRRLFSIKQAQDRLSQRGQEIQALRMLELDSEEGIARRRNEIRTQLFDEFRAQNIDADEAARRADAESQLLVDKEVHENKLQLSKLTAQNSIDIAKSVGNSLGQLNSALFKDSKELAVAQTIANTYAGAMAAFKDTPGNIIIRGLAAAAAVATGIANVKKILSTKLGSKSISQSAPPSQPNITTGFGLVDVGTNAPIAEQVAMGASPSRQSMNPTFIFQGDLDPEMMAIKVSQGRNSISGNTVGIG